MIIIYRLISIIFILDSIAAAMPTGNEEAILCPICLDDIGPDDVWQKLGCCGNLFHERCLKIAKNHGHNKCPICRSILFSSTTMADKIKALGNAFNSYSHWIDVVRANSGLMLGSYTEQLKYRLLTTLSRQAIVSELRTVYVSMMVYWDDLSPQWHKYLDDLRKGLRELSQQLQIRKAALIAQMEDHLPARMVLPNFNFILGVGKYRSVSTRYLDNKLIAVMAMVAKCTAKLDKILASSKDEEGISHVDNIFVQRILGLLIEERVLHSYHSMEGQRNLIVALANESNQRQILNILNDMRVIDSVQLSDQDLHAALNNLSP